MIQTTRAALLTSSLLALISLPLVGCSTKSAPHQESGAMDSAATHETPAEPAPTAAEIEAMEAAPASFKKIRKFIADKAIDKSQSTWRERLPKPPKLDFGDETVYWHLDTTEGDMVFKLMTDVAPMHVSNAMYLSELGFYDDLMFHRVLPRFMAQGGCPKGNGTGNPGYKINLEVTNKVLHDHAGILSTANSGPNTDGSQFFIMFVPYPSLDGKYSIYGDIVEGAEVLKKLELNAGTQANGGRPKKKMIINKAWVTYE